MEAPNGQDENFSMQIFNFWNDCKVMINGTLFHISKEVISGDEFGHEG